MIHDNPHRWLGHLFDVTGSLIPEITGRVLSCVGWAVALVLFHNDVGRVDVPATVHTLLRPVLGLLLVFRTNSSDNRLWEGREIWGRLVNESRNLARSASVHLRSAPVLLDTLIRRVGAFPYAVKNRLRGTEGLGPLADEIPIAELEKVERSEHPALTVSKRITTLLVEARDKGLISDIVLVSLDHNVQLQIDDLGGSGRINSTPLPFAYMVHLRRVMIIY